MDRFPSISTESTRDITKNKNDTIPTWVRESSEKKPIRKEWEESKLQWRKETKKSQRSFSKNKERDYVASKPKDEKSRKPFWNTFEKTPQRDPSRMTETEKKSSEWNERKSSWDKNSVKPGTGFEKSKTWYKWVGSAWDKSTAPRVITRKWDTDTEKTAKTKSEGKTWGYQWKNPSWGKAQNPDAPNREFQSENKKNYLKPNFKKDTVKTETKQEKYTPPKPTWEKDATKIDKKKLIDPTK